MEYCLLSILEVFVSISALKEIVKFTNIKIWYLLATVQIFKTICLVYYTLMGYDVTPVPSRFYFHAFCTVGILIGKVVLGNANQYFDRNK